MVVTARERSSLESVTKEISSANPHCEVLVVSGDLSTREGIAGFLSDVGPDVLGSVDVLVNNAAMGRQEYFADSSPEDISALFSTNLMAPVMLSHAVLKGMITRRYGRIVNISSISAVRPQETIVTYSSTKTALNGFTKALAAEVGRHAVSVNAIMPAFMRTDMGMDVVKRIMAKNPALNEEDVIANIVRSTPSKQVTSLEDVLSLVRFFIADNAGFVTGQVIGAAGGS